MGVGALAVAVLAVRVASDDALAPATRPTTSRVGGPPPTNCRRCRHDDRRGRSPTPASSSAEASPSCARSSRAHGVDEPLWYEVVKSKQAPKQARAALEAGADLVFVWGGDGMVQRCADVLAGTGAAMAVVPAGTANLLATNLGDPQGHRGRRARRPRAGTTGILDVGRINGERFLVMAGVGFDALMIRDADRALKDRVGRAAYVWTGARHLREKPVDTRIVVDGTTWFHGDATCVLVGNVGTIVGGITAFEAARPDDGRLEVGVVMRQRSGAVVTGDGPDHRRTTRQVAAHRDDLGHQDRCAARPETTVRARRRRPTADPPAQDPGRARRPPRVHATRPRP